jgi:bacterioferritin-associated ferredoxin
MDACPNNHRCDDCRVKFVCHCLRVTEEMVFDALSTGTIQTIQDIRRFTGAGDGCTACHTRLQEYLAIRAQAQPEQEAGSLVLGQV